MDLVVSVLTRGVLIILAVLTGLDYALHRDARHRDSFLLFGSLGGAVALPALTNVPGAPTQWIATAAVVLILAEPYFWLRVVQHHRPVPHWALLLALAGMASSSIAYVAIPAPAPPPVTVYITLYMGLVGIYGSVLLFRGMAQERGQRRRQLTFGAWGSVLLGAALLFAGLRAMAPQLPPLVGVLSSLVSLAAVLAFYAAFAPPRWIQESDKALSLQTRLAIALLVTGAVPVFVIGAFLYGPARSVLTATVLQGLDATAAVQEARISSTVQAYLDMGRLVGSRTALRRNLDEYNRTQDSQVQDSMVAILDDAKSSVPEIFEISLLGVDGRVAASTDRSAIGRDQAATVIPSAQAGYQFLGLSLTPTGTVAELAGPLLDQGRLIGFVLIRADGRRLPAITDDYSGLGKSGATLLASRTSEGGALLLTPSRSDTAAGRLVPPVGDEPIVQAVNGAQMSLSDAVDYRGHRVLASTRYLADLGWGLVVKMDEDEAYELATPVRTAFLLSLLALLVAVPVAGILAARAISGPLLHLAQVATSIQAGELSARARVERRDEIGALADAFNSMTDALVQAREGLADRAAQLEQTNQELERKDAQLQRKNEELEEQYRRVQEASRLKGEFLANMSHELRTPLNGIIGFAELMHDERVGPISPEHKEYLGDILTSANHLLQLINDVLDLSKVESGKMDFYPQPVEIGRVVGEVRDVLRTLAAEKRIRIEVEIDPEVETVVADPGRLKQILYNYLSNAIKFTPSEGQVVVRVTPEGADAYRLAVQDTGIGIAADQMGRLFVEFQQLDSSVAKKYQGTGLGLALTKRLAEAQGGSVGVESTPGAGSTFYAVLPRVMRALDDAPEPRIALPAAFDGDGPSVLVVDDNPTDREWLARVLGKAGYRVAVAESGADALRLCRQQIFDAITLDLLLPDLPGSKVLQEIRTDTPNSTTPVVIVTVLSQADIGLGFAIQDYLIKPVKDAELLTALAHAGVEPSDNQKILVVDDDATVRDLLEANLRSAGFQPICVADGKRGLEVAQTEEIGAVVLDLLMPEMDGFEFLHQLRRTPEGRHTPVIVLTAKDLTSEDRRRLQSSTQAVVSKADGGPSALLAELEAWVTRSPDVATPPATRTGG